MWEESWKMEVEGSGSRFRVIHVAKFDLKNRSESQGSWKSEEGTGECFLLLFFLFLQGTFDERRNSREKA